MTCKSVRVMTNSHGESHGEHHSHDKHKRVGGTIEIWYFENEF